jgi:hypothetical protein
MLKNQNLFYFIFIHISANLHCFIFLVCVIIFNILDDILKFLGKKFSLVSNSVEKIRADLDPAPDPSK